LEETFITDSYKNSGVVKLQRDKGDLRLKASSVTNRTLENFGRHNFYFHFSVRRKPFQLQTQNIAYT